MQTGFVMMGGFLGAISRFFVGRLFSQGVLFPIGTLFINIVGCFLLGLLIPLLRAKFPKSFLLVCTGFIGSFTTFSTFSVETLNLISDKLYWLAFEYVVVSIGLGIAMSFLGSKIATGRLGKQGGKL